MRFCTILFLLFFLLAPLPHAGAIIVKQEPGRNLSAPTGEFVPCGWQFVGKWGGFLGTPIAPHYFVTAKHLGGAVGQKMLFRGKSYTAVESFPCPDNDLAVWRVAEAFPAWASLYTKDREVGKKIFLTGCGTARGAPIHTKEGKLCGWRWGRDDHQQSWGMNSVSGIARYTRPEARWKNEMLLFDFDANGGPNEGIVSRSDSGGAVFLRDTDGLWKLAGIIYGVNNTPFSADADGKGAAGGALFDARGLYSKNPETGKWEYHDLWGLVPEPTTAGATRISSSLPFLQSVVSDLRPFPRNELMLALGTVFALVTIFLLWRRSQHRRKRRRRRIPL